MPDGREPAGRVAREIVLPASPEAVWESLTTPDQLSSWLGSRVELDARRGGLLRLEGGGAVRFGVVEALEPFEYLAFRWRPMVGSPDGPLLGPGTRVEFFLKPKEGGTHLQVVETMMPTASHTSAMASAGASR
jgi:uncharacterized protein YndB with AHSA1/START domain